MAGGELWAKLVERTRSRLTPSLVRCTFGLLMRGSRLVVTVVALALCAPASASAAPTWLEPLDVSTDATSASSTLDVAIDDSGAVTVAWQQDSTVFVSTRPPGGTFSAKEPLSEAGQDASNPRLVSNAAGESVVAWLEVVGGDTIVRYAYRPAGGNFGDAQDLSGAGGSVANRPDLAIASDGTVVAVWERFNTEVYVVQGAVKPAGSSAFGAVSDLSVLSATLNAEELLDAGNPKVAMDPSGNAVVAFLWGGAFDGGTADGIRAVFRPAGGSFTALPGVFTVATPGSDHVDGPRVAMAPNGRATVLWAHYVNADPFIHRILSSARGPTGSFGPQDAVSAAGVDSGNAGAMNLAVDDEDTAVALWAADGVRGATRQSGASFGEPQPVSGPGVFNTPALGFDGEGTAVSVFSGLSGTEPAIQSTSMPRGQGFGAVTDLDTASTLESFSPQPSLAVNAAGDGASAYVKHLEGSALQIRIAPRDGAPPDIGSVNVPATGETGEEIALSASATDTWSTSTIGWDYGDGGTGSGESVTHAWSTPGTKTVTITATDAVGNVATATRNIVISDPVEPPNTTITKAPKPKVKTKKSKVKVKFEFESSEPGSTFTCSLDGSKAAACTSPAVYEVKKGEHTFSVAASGEGGPDPTPATAEFKVKKKKKK